MQNCQLSGLISIVDCLVDEKVGIVKHVNYIPREVGAPDFFHYAAEGCDAKAFNAQRNSRIGGGASYDRNIALAKAIGEVVERYSSAIYEIEDFPLASATCAAFPCVDPSRFALYSKEQYDDPRFPYTKFDGETLVRWAPCQDHLTQETWFVPAAMVLMPYRYGTGESHVVQPIPPNFSSPPHWDLNQPQLRIRVPALHENYC